VIYFTVAEIAVRDQYVFVHGESEVIRLDTRNGEEQKLSCQEGKMLVYDVTTAIVCAPSKAVYLKFNSEK